MNPHARATFTNMADSKSEDWNIITAKSTVFANGLQDRVLNHLRLLEGDSVGFPVDRLEHSLQTATRAYRDGRDEAYVVASLLHDLGGLLGSFNHSDLAAAIIKPFVSEEIHWVIAHHGIFQLYYYQHHFGLTADPRERYRSHPHYAACVEFCEKYDQVSFDPGYLSNPLAFFEPMLRRILARPLDLSTYPTIDDNLAANSI